MVDIKTNLLKNRHTLSEKEYQKEKKYLKTSVTAMVLVVVVVASSSIWNWILTSKLVIVEDSLKKSNAEMKGLVQANAEQIYLKSRLNLLTDFLSSRTVARESLEKILSTDIPGTHISRLAFENDYSLGVTYVASSSPELSSLIKYYEQDTGYFTQVISKGIARTEDKTYQLNLSLALPKDKK